MRLVVAASLSLAGSVASVTDLPRIFMTSTSGSGDLSTWPDAHGLTGLAAADEICRTRAAAALLAVAGEYVALLSDSHDDAYCRVHGLAGKRADACGQSALPTDAGPWYRIDDRPALDIARYAMPAAGDIAYVPLHVQFDETGAPLDASQPWASAAFHPSRTDGSVADGAQTCGDWTRADAGADILLKNAYRAYEQIPGFLTQCSGPARLICVARGAHGPALPRRPAPTARLAFVTSVAGNGDFSTWPQSGGVAGVDGADAVCRSLAASAALPRAQTYKAWLATSASGAPQRFVNDGAWYRTDGARVAASIADLADGTIEAPMQIDEAGRPMRLWAAWTGARADGSPGNGTCDDWRSTSARGAFGWTPAADAYWTQFADGANAPCAGNDAYLYCFGDNDTLFLDGFDLDG